MHYERRAPDLSDLLQKIVITEAVPNGVEHTSGYPERGEVAGVRGIREVARDAKLEKPLAISIRILLPQVRLGKLCAHALDIGRLLPPRELRFEFLAVTAHQRCGVDESESIGCDDCLVA